MKKSHSKTHLLFYILITILLALIVWTIWGNTALMVNSITVSGNQIPSEFSGFRIAQVSDLHNAEFGEENSNLNPTKLSAVRSFYRILLNPRKRLKTLGFKQVNHSFPLIRSHPLLRASRELAREKSREDIGF